MKTKMIALFDVLSTALFYANLAGFAYLLLVVQELSYILATLPAILIVVWLYLKERTLGSRMPGVVRFLIFLMIAMHIFGYVLELYSNIALYDKVGHLIGGLAIGSATVILAMTHAAKHKFTLRASTLVFLPTIIALGIGSVWELIEFGIDRIGVLNFDVLSGQEHLQWGLEDTMYDILWNGLGGLATGIGTLIFVDRSLSDKALSPFFSKYLERRKR